METMAILHTAATQDCQN